jgi:protein gp37
MVFVNSMSDLFHDAVPDQYIAAVARVMKAASWHTFQVLTKRSDRLRRLLDDKLRFASKLDNVWWGVSVENRKHGLPRIEHLRGIDCAVRFLSIEPLLEDIGEVDLTRIDWVIVGGESGPGARKMESGWVDNIRKQCSQAKVPFFFKQWGGVQKKKAGRRLHGRTYDSMPPRQELPVPPKADRIAEAEGLGEFFPLSGLATS